MTEMLFKRNLSKLQKEIKPKTFAQALIGVEFGDWSFVHQNSDIPLKQAANAPTPSKVEVKTELTEKRVVLESLNQFTEKIKQTGKSKLEFPGGELVIKPEVSDRKELVLKQKRSFSELKEFYLNNNLSSFYQARMDKYQKPVKVMFLLEKIFPKPLYSAAHENYEELKYLLEESTAILLARMIDAMKLEPTDFFISAVEVEGCQEKVLLSEINLLRPEIIVAFGAVATQELLLINERLHHIHGKFFNRTLLTDQDSYDFEVVPLFHPEFLRINPKMKATAWQDMQLIMKKIGKA